MDPLKQVQPETVNRKVTLKQPLKVTPKSDLLHLEARRCSYTGPTRGHEPRCVSVAGPFNAMKSPVGFRGYEGASFSDTQLNKDPAGLRATMPGANPGVVSSGADGHESSLKTPILGAGDRQMAKMVTCPPTASSSSRNPKPTRARRFAGQSDPWGA